MKGALRTRKFFGLVAGMVGSLLLALIVASPLHAGTVKGGDPLPGLTAPELAQFDEGTLTFRTPVFAQQGLGPAFNATRCYSCHHGHGLGGQSKILETRFGRVDMGVFDPLASLGGSLQQIRAISAECAEAVPVEANIVIQRNSTSALGAGLTEAIPDQQIIDRAAAELVENPARAGRVHMVTEVSDGLPHPGRFGWKAQHALIVDFSGDAMLNELGFTNALFPTDNAPNGNLALLAQCDSVADPEDTTDFLHKVTNVQRFLAPPAVPKVTDLTIQGEALFNSIGCAFCHYRGYTTVSSSAALDGKSVDLFSDLLLHDIGTGDGIEQGDAKGNEFRTAFLWGLRGTYPYLHDGRAHTVAEAIDMHQGQALDVRNAYTALSAFEKNAVLRFLRR